jgi:AraC-like DNA-binding protein
VRQEVAFSRLHRSEAGPQSVLQKTLSGKFLEFMRERLGSPAWFFAGTHIDQGIVPARICVEDYLRIVANIVRHGPDPTYHLTLIKLGFPVHTPGLDLGIRFAPNLGSALELLVRHEPRRRHYDKMSLIKVDHRAIVVMDELVDLGLATCPLVETPLLHIVRTIATYAFDRMDEIQVEFRHPAPESLDCLLESFRCPLAFDAPRNSVSFPEDWLSRPNVTVDIALWQMAKARCRVEDEEAQCGDISLHVRNQITSSILKRRAAPKLAEAAFLNHVSSRTLIRRLRAEGAQYRGLVDQSLKQLALEMISDRHCSIGEIADCLGFADPSSFHRSFKRWFGESPSRFKSAIETSVV